MVLTVNAEVTGNVAPHMTAPVQGDYRFVFGKNQASVSSPSGKRFVFDFQRRIFTSVDPAARTYYQTEIPSVLGVGDRLPSTHSTNKVKGAVTFEPIHEDAPPSDVARSVKSYEVVLESTLFNVQGSPGGLGGGFSTRGGLVFGGGGSSERSTEVGRRVVQGRFLMGDAPVGLDRDQMNTAIECVLLWGAPQLSEFSRRIHDSGLAIFGAQFSVQVEGQRNSIISPPPIVSIKFTSITSGTLDPVTLTFPQDYRHVSPPVGPFGG
jgi:hypothetical protein